MNKKQEFKTALKKIALDIQEQLNYCIESEDWHFTKKQSVVISLRRSVEEFNDTHHNYLCSIDKERELLNNKRRRMENESSQHKA